MKEAIFRIGCKPDKIYRNEVEYRKTLKGQGFSVLSDSFLDISKNIYLDDALARIQAASEGADVKKAETGTLFYVDGKIVKSTDVHEGDRADVVDQLVVGYKGDPAKLVIPDDVRKKFKIIASPAAPG